MVTGLIVAGVRRVAGLCLWSGVRGLAGGAEAARRDSAGTYERLYLRFTLYAYKRPRRAQSQTYPVSGTHRCARMAEVES